MSIGDKKDQYSFDKRSFSRFDIKRHSIEIGLIVDNYKRIPALSVVNNISLGGMGVLTKEKLEVGLDIKFHIEKSKTVFNGSVVWCKDSDLETYRYSVGLSFSFPHKEEFDLQQKELIAFILKNLNKLSKKELIERIMELFIERRRIFDSAREHIKEANELIRKTKEKSNDFFNKVHNLIDYNFTPVLYFSDQYEILYHNKAVEDILGYSVEELKKIKLQNLLSPNSRKIFQKSLKSKNVTSYSGSIINKNGNEIPILWKAVPYLHDGKNLMSFLFIEK